MGFWHTGYAEFHEMTGLEGGHNTLPPPVRYFCDYCNESFDCVESLRRHRFQSHPIRRPLLLVRGKSCGSSQQLMSALHPTDVIVEDASSCRLNDKPVELAEIGCYLAVMKREFVVIELMNQDVTIRYELDFRVADEQQLAGIDSAFLRLVRDRVLNLEAVSRFNEDCRVFADAMVYCDGISNYLYGVMAKERSTDSGLQYSEYIERFLRASEQLSGFDRPLADSIRALVAFHFNHFDIAMKLAPKGVLHETAVAFAGLLNCLPWLIKEDIPPLPAGTVESLLIDQDTLQLLDYARFAIPGLKERAEELQAPLRKKIIGSYDEVKHVLLACEALAACDNLASHDQAVRLARQLAGKSETSDWANHIIERLKTHE